MKIAIVVPYFASYIRSNEYGLADGLSRAGHEVTVFASEEIAVRERAARTGVDPDLLPFAVERLPAQTRAFENPVVLGMAKKMQGFDVAMLQEDYPFICIDAYRGCQKYGVRTVLSTERYYLPDGAKGFGLWAIERVCAGLRAGVDVVTAHTRASRDYALRHTRRWIEVVPVGVDTELFEPINGEHDGFRIGTVARLHPYKGLEYLMAAMPYVRKEVPDATLTILGRGPDAQRLETFAATQSSAISFDRRSCPNNIMPSWYAGRDLYAQPSLIEPFGIAAVEAMSCGLPIIANPTGGLADTVADGETGRLVPSKDIKMLADTIITLAQDETLRIRMSARARERAARYDWHAVCDRYLKIIEEIP